MVADLHNRRASPLWASLIGARLLPSWPLALGFFAFAHAAFKPGLLNDPDTYLHIAAGQWMVGHGTLPTSDPFSHTLTGGHWVVHEWLAELVLGTTYADLGWPGVMLITAACSGLAITLLTRFLLQRGEVLITLLLALGSLFLLQTHLLARPHLLALPVMVAWCGGLIATRDARRPPPYVLLPLMTLWANLHGSFMVGIGLAVFLGIEAILDNPRAWRDAAGRWGGFALLALGAALIDPNGLDSVLQPIRMMRMTVLQNSFQEWLSPNFHEVQPLEFWLLGLLFCGFAFGLKLPLWRLMFILGLVHLGLAAGRHGDLIAVLLPLLVAAPLGAQVQARMTAQGPAPLAERFAALAAPARWPAVALMAVVVLAVSGLRLATPIVRPDGMATPAAALAAAERAGLSGPVFNAEPFGGYLVFSGVPTFIDGRAELYGSEFLARYVDVARGDEAALTELLERYHIAWAMTESKSGAALILERLPGWQRIYQDQYAVIDRRVDASPR